MPRAILILLFLAACGGDDGGPPDADTTDAPPRPDADTTDAAPGIDVIIPECTIQLGHRGPPIVTGFTPDHICRGGKVIVTGMELAGGCAMMNFHSMFVGYEEGDTVTSFRIPEDMTPTNDVFVVHNEYGMGMSPFVLWIEDNHVPVLTGISPGQVMAGQSVTATGSYLTGASVELANDTATSAPTITMSADDTLTFTVPDMPVGYYNVTFSVPNCGFTVVLNGVQII